MSKELALVILLSRSCFDKYLIRRIEHLLKGGIDWFQVFNLSVQRQTAYLTYSALRDLHYLHLLPERVRAFWTVSYYGNIRRNHRLLEEGSQLITEFQKREILIHPIKGIALLKMVYEDIGVRYLSDVDFLSLPQFRVAICETLEQLHFEPLYINDTDPYLCDSYAQGYHSLFYTKKVADPNDIDFCCEFSFSLCALEDHSLLFQYITESLALSRSAPAFHAAHILLLCIYYFQAMEKLGFPKDLESENLMKLADIHTYISHYWGKEIQLELENTSSLFHLEHIISYTTDHMKQFWRK